MNKAGKIVVFTGLTAVGKDVSAHYVEREYGANFVTSTTSRPIRDNETPDIDYHFCTRDEFGVMVNNGEIFEYRYYDTLVNNVQDRWYYGTSKTEIKDYCLNVAVVDSTGVKSFKEEYGDRCIVILLSTSIETSKELCMNRGDYDESEFTRRMSTDTPKFNDEFIDTYVDYIVNNRGEGIGELTLEIDSVLEEEGIE